MFGRRRWQHRVETMSDILQLIYYTSTVIIVFPIGLAVVLLAKKEQENWIPKSYMYGTAILTISSYWLSCFSKNGLRGPSKYFILLALLGAVSICVIRRTLFRQYLKSVSKGDIINFLICSVLGALPMVLIIGFGAQFPYIDGYTYICNADYLMDYGYNVIIQPEDTMLHPWLSQTMLYQNANLRIGAQMFLALFSGLFNVKFSLELFMPITAYGVFLCGMAAWSFASKKYAESRYYKTIAIILVVANVPIVLWNAVYGFMPQTFGSAFFMAALAAILGFENWKKDAKWNILSTALLFACGALCYNEMLPFLVLVTAMIILKYLILNKNERKQIIVYISCCAITAMIYIVTFVPSMIRSTLAQFGVVVGWHQDKDIYTYISYFLSTVPAEYSFHSVPYSMTLFFYEILTVILLVAVIIGFGKSKKSVKTEFICVSLPYVLVLLYFVIFTDNPFIGGRGNSWSIYKLMQYYFVAAVPYIAICISEILNKMHKAVIIVIIAGFAMFNMGNAVSYMETLSYSMENYVEESEESIYEYYKLYEQYGQSEQRIILHNIPDKHRQMITYFLKDVELISDWNRDVYYSVIPDMPQQLFNTGIHLTYDLDATGGVAGLVERDVNLEMGEGFYEQESDEDSYWNWSKKESTISIVNYTSNDLLLCFEVFGIKNEETEELRIYSNNNELLQRVEVVPGELTNIKVNVPADMSEIHFSYSGDEVVSETDARELAFAVKGYTIQAIKE